MLTIRLRRIGKRQHATFRFIVSEQRRSPQSSVNEFLGSYDPHTNPATVQLQKERITYWISKGAQPSATVHNLLVEAGVIPGPKVRVGRAKKVEAAPTADVAPSPAAETPAA